jgi:hypothetical protein
LFSTILVPYAQVNLDAEWCTRLEMSD